MCKFYILGVCTKGNNCRFAHDRAELQSLPDLQRTKLCKTLISTGECNNPSCRYAHNKDELRPLPNSPFMTTMLGQQSEDSIQPELGGFMAAASNNMPTPLHQAAFDSAMHQAILQVGQAAQAHAVEAARLQALAAQLQTGTVPNAKGVAPFFAGGGAFSGGPLDQQAFGQQFGEDGTPYSADATHDLLLGLGNPGAVDGHMGWRPDDGSDITADLAAASGAEPEADCWAATMTRVRGDEPVQIRPETLRSLSNSSLAMLSGCGSDDDDAPATPGHATPQKAGVVHRQGRQFGAFVEVGPGRGGEKRSQDTPIAEGAKKAVGGADSGSPGGAERRSTEGTADMAAGPAFAEASYSAPARWVETTGGSHALYDGPALVGDGEEMRWRAMPASLNDTLSATGITVKNTFLDFAPREPVSTLRAVQTAAGRLDLMGQE